MLGLCEGEKEFPRRDKGHDFEQVNPYYYIVDNCERTKNLVELVQSTDFS